MLNSIKNNIGIVIILGLIIAFFAWFAMSEKEPAPGLLTVEGINNSSSKEERELLRLLLDMKSIRLDGSIFERPAFLYLKDFGREIISEPVGRKNPFAPIGENEGTENSADDNTVKSGVDVENF